MVSGGEDCFGLGLFFGDGGDSNLKIIKSNFPEVMVKPNCQYFVFIHS